LAKVKTEIFSAALGYIPMISGRKFVSTAGKFLNNRILLLLPNYLHKMISGSTHW
jgi:hypothetical protein